MQDSTFGKQIASHWVRRALWFTAVLALFGWVAAAAPDRMGQTAFAQEEKGKAKPTITINLAKVTGQIAANALGTTIANKGHEVPELTYLFRTPEGKQKLAELGFRTISYGVDKDDWEHPYNNYTAVPEFFPTIMLTPEFLTLAQSQNADPMIAVNITIDCEQKDSKLPPSTANVQCQMTTPQRSVDWINFLKTQPGPKVKYVQLGTEPYAGCLWWKQPDGVNCTTKIDLHKVALSQQDYTNRVKQWSKLLKKADPTIKVGAHLQPNTFLCGGPCKMEWDQQVLQKAGKQIDFVLTHQFYMLQHPAADAATAQRYSYYQNHRDMRVIKNNVTATPTQIRKELIKWLPGKKNMPIVIGEYNAGLVESDNESERITTRMSLYTGFAVTEAALDMLSPVQLNGQTYPGAERVLMLDLQSVPAMIVHYFSQNIPPRFVYAPTWYMFSAIKDLQGKKWVATTLANNPKTPGGRGALRVYTVKQGKKVWIAVYNHNATNPITADVIVAGGKPKNGTATRVGDTAASFLDMNTAANPTAISTTTETIPASKFKTDRIAGMVFPAHSLTVIQLKVK